MTEYLTLDDGQIAYDVTGAGPLVVLSHGMGDRRTAYAHLAPLLVEAGYRVATADLRGSGESSTGWPGYTPHPHRRGPARPHPSPRWARGHRRPLVQRRCRDNRRRRRPRPGAAPLSRSGRSPGCPSCSVRGLRVGRYRKGTTRLLLMGLLRQQQAVDALPRRRLPRCQAGRLREPHRLAGQQSGRAGTHGGAAQDGHGEAEGRRRQAGRRWPVPCSS